MKEYFKTHRHILRVLSAFVKVGTVISAIALTFAFREALIVLLSYVLIWLAVYRPLRRRFQEKCVLLNLEKSLKSGFSDVAYVQNPGLQREIIDPCGILPESKAKGFISRDQLTYKTNDYSWRSVDLNYFADKTNPFPIDSFSGTYIKIMLNRNDFPHFQLRRKMADSKTASKMQGELSYIFDVEAPAPNHLPETLKEPIRKLAAQTGEYIGLSVKGNELCLALAGDYFKSRYKLSLAISEEALSMPPVPKFRIIEEIVNALVRPER